MKPLTLLLALLLGYLFPVTAQSAVIQWNNCYGGAGPAGETGTFIQPTADGGYIMVGDVIANGGDISGIHGSGDCWVVKLNSVGAIQWSKSLGGDYTEDAFAIRQAADGTYWLLAITAGPASGDVTVPSRGWTDLWLVQLDPGGNILFQNRYGKAGNYRKGNFRFTPDGGVIMVTCTDANGGDVTGHIGQIDGWVVKVDKDKNIQWQKCVGGSLNDALTDVEVLPDGTLFAVGEAYSPRLPRHHNDVDGFAVRLDNAGNILWQKCYGGFFQDEVTGVALSPGGGVVMGGWTASSDGDVVNHIGLESFWAVALDDDGNIKWQHCYGSLGTNECHSIAATSDNGYLLSGWAFGGGGDLGCPNGNSGWVIKVDAGGAPRWSRVLGSVSSPGVSYDGDIYYAAATPDGGAIAIGATNNPFLPRYHGLAGIPGPPPAADMYVAKLIPSSSVPTVTLGPQVPACQGASFTLNPTTSGNIVSYTWLRNGVDQGINTPTYTASNFNDGDQVAVKIFYNIDECTMASVTSNTVTITLKTTITPTVVITATGTSVCEGAPANFTATVTDGGPGPVYQWLVNGQPQGGNSPAFSSSTLSNNDVVTCMVTGNACTMPAQGTSNPVTMTVIRNRPTTLNIRVFPTPACAGQSVEFQAVSSGLNPSASYQWSVNGQPAGAGGGPTYQNSHLADGDLVSCTATYSIGCNLPGTANATAAIEAYPVISPVPPVILPKGQSVLLDVPVSGAVTSYTWSPSAGLSDPTAARPIADPLQTTHYTVIAATQAGCADTAEVVVEVQTALGIPNGFTPNGDGKNDIFYVVGGPIGCMIKDLLVYDRWGSCVFKMHDVPTNDPAYGWSGSGAPAGAYVYYLRLSVPGVKDQLYRGTLMLVR